MNTLEIQAELERLYGQPMCGRNRAVYTVGDYVIKVPINENGHWDNLRESRNYLTLGDNHPNFFPLAKCFLVHVDELPILYMEKVEQLKNPYGEHQPSWIDFVDCGQVGYTKDGRLVAYDYGDK